MRHCLMTESRHAVAVMLSCITGELHLVYGREVVVINFKECTIRLFLRTSRYSQKNI